MLRIILSGCNGRMGKVVSQICSEMENVSIVAGIDLITTRNFSYPVYPQAAKIEETADVVIDFSNPAALPALLDYCTANKLPIVIATTGLDQNIINAIDKAAQLIPVFRSANMSLGINVLMMIVERAAKILSDTYDIEIIEKHHNQKLDAPSGTALMIADAVKQAIDFEPEYVYDRSQVRKKREKHEIGISAIRGGTIVGEHQVIFAGRDETVEITHTALSREIFASGAVKAAAFLAGCKNAGVYSMQDLVNA